MSFKEFLFLEFGNPQSASDFFYGLQLYPSDAFDFEYASRFPAELFFLRKRWKIEKGEGRKFHGIDYDQFQQTRFDSVQSTDMPGTGYGYWKNKKDTNKHVKVVKDVDLKNIGISKNGKKPFVNKNRNPDLKINLEKLFGDKETGNFQVLPDDFDTSWDRYVEDVTPFQVLGFKRDVNARMGVRSKYVGPDETKKGEPSQDDESIKSFANFLGRRHKKKKRFE